MGGAMVVASSLLAALGRFCCVGSSPAFL